MTIPVNPVELVFYVLAQTIGVFLFGYTWVIVAMVTEMSRDLLDQLRTSTAAFTLDFGDIMYVTMSVGFSVLQGFAFWLVRKGNDEYSDLWRSALSFYIMLLALAFWPMFSAFFSFFIISLGIIIVAFAACVCTAVFYWLDEGFVPAILAIISAVWLGYLIYSNAIWAYTDLRMGPRNSAERRLARAREMTREVRDDIARFGSTMLAPDRTPARTSRASSSRGFAPSLAEADPHHIHTDRGIGAAVRVVTPSAFASGKNAGGY